MLLQDLKPGELLEIKALGLHVICKFLSYCKRPRHIHVEALRVVIGEVVEGREACIPIKKYMSRYGPSGNDQTDLCSAEYEEANKLIQSLEKQLFDYHINKALDDGDKEKFLELVRGIKHHGYGC